MDIKKYVKSIASIKKSPHSIALGFAVGSFIAIMPTLGTGPLIALVVLLIFTKLNKIALFGSFLIWNPLVMTSVYYLSYKIGNLVFGRAPLIAFEFSISNIIKFFSLKFLVGNTILAILVSVLSYFIIKTIAVNYQKKILTKKNNI